MALRGGDDEDEAPWLAAAEPDGRETYVSRRRFKLVGVLLGALVLVVAALIYAVIARPHDSGGEISYDGDIPLIRAPDGPFRTRPADAGGMNVEGLNQTTYEAAGGVDPQGELALDQIPEEPMARPVAPPKPQPAPPQVQQQPREEQPLPPPLRVQPQVVTPPAPPAPKAPPAPAPKKDPLPEVVKTPEKPKAPEKPKPSETPKAAETPKKADTPKKAEAKAGDHLADLMGDIDKAAAKAPKKKPAAEEAETPAPTGSSGPAALQLGAFSSSAKADAAWKNFGRYSYLSGLTKSVTKVEREGGETVYRLKATGVESREKASNLCARLKVAGEQCVVSQ